MKLREICKKPYGLRLRFVLSFLISGVLCVLIFFLLSIGAEKTLSYYFGHSDFEEKHIQRQAESLQAYIDKNGINKSNLSELSRWEKRQPLILLELYDQSELIYSSANSESAEYYEDETEYGAISEQENAFFIHLENEEVTALIYSDFTYKYYVWGTVCAFSCTLIIFVVIFISSISKMIRYICKLENDIQILEGGNLEYEVTEQGNDELTNLAKSMNRMRVSFREQMESEQALHQSHQHLITEMAHDLRTPLTSILLYTEILRSHRYESEEEFLSYLEKIDLKAHHIKALSDHLFEYNLENEVREKLEILGFQNTISIALEHLVGDLNARGFQVDTFLDWESCYIQAKKEYLDRIFDNISSNIVKYAQKDVSIQIQTLYSGNYAGVVVTNTIASVPNTIESTSVGVKSIQTMMKQMEGVCSVEQTESVFEITILFLKV